MSILDKNHELSGMGKRASCTTAKPSQSRRPIPRRRLPWLDGPSSAGSRTILASDKGSRESISSNKVTGAGKKNVNIEPIAQPSRSKSIASKDDDTSLQPATTTHSLQSRAKAPDPKSVASRLRLRPGVPPLTARRDAKKSVAATVAPKSRDNASSEYSVDQSSASRDRRTNTIARSDAATQQDPEARSFSRQYNKPPHSNPLGQQAIPRKDDPHENQLRPQAYVRSPPRDSIGCKPCEETAYERPSSAQYVAPRSKTMALKFAPVSLPERMPHSPPEPPQTLGRKSTLLPMPTHLLASSGTSSISPGATSPPKPNSTPPPPPPRRSSARVQGRQIEGLTRAVTGLETLVDEALTVARNAARDGRTDEVATILNNATSALRRSSSVVQKQAHTGAANLPLVLSPIGSARGSERGHDESSGSDTSFVYHEQRSIRGMPTAVSQSAPQGRFPEFRNDYDSGQSAPRSLKAAVEDNRLGGPPLSPTRQGSPRLYEVPSVDSIIRDFAYAKAKAAKSDAGRRRSKSWGYGSAAEYYADMGQSVATQPGVRPSINPPMIRDDMRMPSLPSASHGKRRTSQTGLHRDTTDHVIPDGGRQDKPAHRLSTIPVGSIASPRRSTRTYARLDDPDPPPLVSRPRLERPQRHPHLSYLFESSYYNTKRPKTPPATKELTRALSNVTDTRYEKQPISNAIETLSEDTTRYSGPETLLEKDFSLKHPRRKHISLQEGQGFSLGRYHRRQPIAREWSTFRKRITATIACANTMFIGLIAGIYAGEVPRLQYQLADTSHKVILGNVLLFATLGVTTLIFWPLPLLHGRKPYTLLAFTIVLPLLFPQALAVSSYHGPNNPLYRCGLLIPRAFKGVALGFANINFLPTLFDLFGASLMPEKPHQEIVVYDDVRRQGGGLGVWLGIWSFCFVGSMSIGFCVGAVIISVLDPSWGFYIIVILLAVFLLVNVIAPETRRSPYRRSIAQFLDGEDKIKRRVARGEVKLHISNEGPKFWFEEVWAGLILTKRMVTQPGFFVLMLYLAWMYAQVTLVILLLGALLSRDYKWQPQYVGAASLAMAIGAFLAMPLSKANLFSRARDKPQRTDSMTMRHGRVTWSSHMLRRCLFTLTLPFAALAYTLASPGPSVNWATPVVFCGFVGFLSNLAIAECVGLIMETFDTCDLQPGVNSKHRLQSLAETTRRRRTNYSSFPRICAGFFAAQSLGFVLSAAATGVSGDVTRAVGAQTATAIVAGILLVLTVLFIAVLWRWKEVQVVPNNPFGLESKGGIVWGPAGDDPEWKPVIIGNPSGKMRRMNLLELGSLSRWAEIRTLNKLAHG